MTPNPNSPEFIMHDIIPDSACDASKQIAQIFNQLKEDVKNNRWDCITQDNISLSYNTSNGFTELLVTLKDSNNHLHSFRMQFPPCDGGEITPDDIFALNYSFENNFNENHPETRSFVNYLSEYLSFNEFEVEPFLHPYIEKDNEDKYIVKYTEGLNTHCAITCAYTAFCSLIDITCSHIKPLEWFYTEEPNINSFDEVCNYFDSIKSKLQSECCNGRWPNINPNCFNLRVYPEDEDAFLRVSYIVDNVWVLSLYYFVFQSDDIFEFYCSFYCHPDKKLSDGVQEQLYTLFDDFITTLKLADGNTYATDRYNSICIPCLYIDDIFDIFCKMLDEIVPALQNFNFQLPVHPVKLSGNIEALKGQLEEALNTTFEIETEEELINKKLNNGHFRLY